MAAPENTPDDRSLLGLQSIQTSATGLRSPLGAAVVSVWALLLGMAMAMLGNGLQTTLLGIRAGLEGFNSSSTGLVMSGYFLGFAIGSTVTPKLVGRVGHIRVFAALASLASVAALLHLLHVSPWSWAAMRLITGISYAGLYVVAESWLNDQADNSTRGRLLSVYMLAAMGGMTLGPLLINLDDPGGYELLVLSSVLVSVALMPILLTVRPQPKFDEPTPIGMVSLYRAAPLGVIGCFMTGISNATLFGFGAVYAQAIGLSVAQTSLLVTSSLFGGVVLQWPIGWLSDRFDRRLVLTVVTFVAAGASAAAILVAGVSVPGLMAVVGLVGGCSLTLYSLNVAHTNDRLEPSQMVAASSTLVMIGGVGAVLGPLVVGSLIDLIGPNAFFGWMVAVHLALGVFALYRMSVRPATPIDEQGPSVWITQPAAATATAAAYEAAEEEAATP